MGTALNVGGSDRTQAWHLLDILIVSLYLAISCSPLFPLLDCILYPTERATFAHKEDRTHTSTSVTKFFLKNSGSNLKFIFFTSVWVKGDSSPRTRPSFSSQKRPKDMFNTFKLLNYCISKQTCFDHSTI